MHLTRKQIFIAKLCLCSFGAHLFLLLCFFLSRGDRFPQHINFSLPADVKFIYMPFQKRVGLQAQTGAESGQAASTNANALTSQQAQELAQKKTKTVMTRPGKKKGRKKAKKPQMKAPEPKPKKQTPLPVPESRPSTDNSTPT